MKIEYTTLKDCFVLTPTIYKDERGTFFETYNKVLFERVTGQKVNFIQDNQSTSNLGTLRGLHYQVGEMAQAKLVRVLEGSILDVVVDIRKESETFGKHFSIILDDVSQQQLFVPRGFAHGFASLENNSCLVYKTDSIHAPQSDGGIRWDSIDFNWPFDSPVISERDSSFPAFEDFKSPFTI